MTMVYEEMPDEPIGCVEPKSLLWSYTFGQNRTSDGNPSTNVMPPDDDHTKPITVGSMASK
jgi:hypothetical protein